jgi:hypothetical protein
MRALQRAFLSPLYDGHVRSSAPNRHIHAIRGALGIRSKWEFFEMIHSNDVVQELEDWLSQRVRDAQLRKRSDERPEIEVDLVRRATAEIKALRERLGLRRETRSIAPEDLNASNDE